MPKPAEVIARNIRMRRAWLGLGTGEVAKRAGLSRNSITNYEAGQRPRVDKLKQLAAALETTVEDLEDPGMYECGAGGGPGMTVDTVELLKLAQANHLEEFRQLQSRINRMADQLNNHSRRLDIQLDALVSLGKRVKVDVWNLMEKAKQKVTRIQ